MQHVSKFTRLMFFFTLGILGMVGYIFFLLFGPYTIPHVGLIRPTTEVKAGHLIRYEAEDCHPTNQEADISRLLISTERNPEVLIGVGASVFRTFRCSNILLIPAEVPTGNYQLVITARYRVNPLRTVTQEYHSEVFHVENDNPDIKIPAALPQPVATSTTPHSTVTTAAPPHPAPSTKSEAPSQPASQPATQPSQPAPSPQPDTLGDHLPGFTKSMCRALPIDHLLCEVKLGEMN